MDGGGGIALPNAACLTECAKNVLRLILIHLKKSFQHSYCGLSRINHCVGIFCMNKFHQLKIQPIANKHSNNFCNIIICKT